MFSSACCGSAPLRPVAGCRRVLRPTGNFRPFALETHHYRLWIDLRAAHIEHVTQTTLARLASLDTTHAARLSLLEEQRDDANDARIRRMKESQIETARRDYERRAEELRMAPEQAEVLAEAVAFGVLMVEGQK